MKRLILAAAMLFVAVCANAQYNTVKDLSYVSEGDAYRMERCRLDVYYPEAAKDAPVVVWFHGGGLTAGNRYIPEQLKESGLVVVAVNYRLMPKASNEDCIDDAAAAVAWTLSNAERYNGSPAKVYVSGHSAGGYLADMIGLDKKWLAKYGVDADCLAGLAPFSGQVLTHFNRRAQMGIGPLQPVIDELAPLTYVRGDCPPMLIVSGDREKELYGRYEEQAYFWRLLKLCGLKEVYLYEMQGYDHGSMPGPAYKILKDFIAGKL